MNKELYALYRSTVGIGGSETGRNLRKSGVALLACIMSEPGKGKS